MNYYLVESELYHHGIKGQKWGVRRYQNADGSLTAAGIKRYERDLSETGSIKKGSKLYRVTANKDEGLGGSKYVTYYQSDRNFYRGTGSEWIKSVAKTNTLYEKTYVANNELRIAKGKDVADALNTLASKDKKMDESSSKAYAEFLSTNSGYGAEKTLNDFYSAAKKNKTITDSQATEVLRRKFGAETYDNYVKNNPTHREGLINAAKDASKRYTANYNNAKKIISEHSDETTTTFIRAVGMGTASGKYTQQKVESYLKAKGYQGMSDLAGMGGNSGWAREARQTMIMFDTDSNLSTKKTKKVNYSTTNKATGNYYSWRNYTKSYSNLRLT